MTARKYAWKISPNLKKKSKRRLTVKLDKDLKQDKTQCSANYLTFLFPLCDTDTFKALCIQQEASIAAVWLENSRKWTFLRNLRRYGKRMLITITHLLDLHSTASRCKWADFLFRPWCSAIVVRTPPVATTSRERPRAQPLHAWSLEDLENLYSEVKKVHLTRPIACVAGEISRASAIAGFQCHAIQNTSK